MEKQKITVYQVVRNIISRLEEGRDTGQGKALLANLRNSVGSDFQNSMDGWAFVFEYMPQEFLSRTGEPTSEENAIFHTLQLYAIHQQGKTESVMSENNKKNEDIGSSLRSLRSTEDSTASDRRFNALVTSTNYEELIHHLRQLIKQLKSKSDTKVNYALLAQDLFWFQKGSREKIRFQWSQSYYYINTKEKGEKNEQ